MHRTYFNSQLLMKFHLEWMESTEHNLIWRTFGPSTSRNLITRVLPIYDVNLTQSTALEQKRFDLRQEPIFRLRSMPPALRNLLLLLVCTQHSFGIPLRMNGTHRAQTDHSSTRDLITHVLTFFHVKLTQNKAQHWSKSVCMDLARSPKPWVIPSRQLKVAEINKRHRSWNY